MRAVGVDFGLRRIGVAVSDASRTLARPLRTLQRPLGDAPQHAALAVLDAVEAIEREGDPVTTIVVGLPRRLDGSSSDQTTAVETFVAALRAGTSRAVQLQDERLTSHEAEARLAERERDWRKRKAQLDAAAAAILLQDYLDSHAPVPAWHPDDTD
jgi:putative pre-16S rRNA nuclease